MKSSANSVAALTPLPVDGMIAAASTTLLAVRGPAAEVGHFRGRRCWELRATVGGHVFQRAR